PLSARDDRDTLMVCRVAGPRRHTQCPSSVGICRRFFTTLGGWSEGLGHGGSWPVDLFILPTRAVEGAPDDPPEASSTAYAALRISGTVTPPLVPDTALLLAVKTDERKTAEFYQGATSQQSLTQPQ